MDAFYERLIVRAATIDELLSADFEPLPGQKGDADLAGRRLAAWCRSCASGDWSLFERRLMRDGLTLAQALTRFASIRRKPSAAPPPWIADAIWIEAALQSAGEDAKPPAAHDRAEPCAFEHLLAPVVVEAEARLCSNVDARALSNLTESARASLRRSLLDELSAPHRAGALRALRPGAKGRSRAVRYGTGAADRLGLDIALRSVRRRNERRRLPASVRRQAGPVAAYRHPHAAVDRNGARISSSASTPIWRRSAAIFSSPAPPAGSPRSRAVSPIRTMAAARSCIVGFEDGARVVYKPKDLRLDVAWQRLDRSVEPERRPGRAEAGARASRATAMAGPNSSTHAGCADAEGCQRFFRRAGAWLALLHCFAATDMHQENLIAAGDHPVPIDLETMLQPTADENKSEDPEGQAFDAAIEMHRQLGHDGRPASRLSAALRKTRSSPSAA